MRELPAGPTQAPFVQMTRWLLRPISFMEDCRRRYGDAFSVMFPGFTTPTVFVSDPAAIRALYTERANVLPPGREVTLRPVMGARSILLLEGTDHISRRKVMLPPFHGDRMRAYEPIVREVAEREIDSWRPGDEFAIHPRMQAVTLEVILRAVFGMGTDNSHREELTRLLVRLLNRTSSVALQFGIFFAARLGIDGPMQRIERENAELDELLLAEIAEHGEDGDDILSLLKAARFEDGEPMSDREVRDQLVTLLLAGHETTATALAWTFDLLLRHPDVHAALVGAVDAGDDAYVRATVTEALRLRPVVPLAGRRLGTDLETDSLFLPAGTDVTPAIWLAHTNPAHYDEPYAFRPERWLGTKPDTYAWVPFGGGVRRCLGAAFAELEMRIVLSAVLQRRALRPVTTSAERVARRNVTFSPAKGTRLIAATR